MLFGEINGELGNGGLIVACHSSPKGRTVSVDEAERDVLLPAAEAPTRAWARLALPFKPNATSGGRVPWAHGSSQEAVDCPKSRNAVFPVTGHAIYAAGTAKPVYWTL